MADPPTTFARIKLIAKDDKGIQALTGAEPEVLMVLEDAALAVTEAVFGKWTEIAQRYISAHFLSLHFQPVGGRGPLSSYSIGGISRSFTLPYLNQKTVLGSTQYGLYFMEIRDNSVPAFAVAMPGVV